MPAPARHFFSVRTPLPRRPWSDGGSPRKVASATQGRRRSSCTPISRATIHAAPALSIGPPRPRRRFLPHLRLRHFLRASLISPRALDVQPALHAMGVGPHTDVEPPRKVQERRRLPFRNALVASLLASRTGDTKRRPSPPRPPMAERTRVRLAGPGCPRRADYQPHFSFLVSSSSHLASGAKYSRSAEASPFVSPEIAFIASGHGLLAPSDSIARSFAPASLLP